MVSNGSCKRIVFLKRNIYKMEKGEKNMIFEFSKMEDTVIPNFYGGEKHISAKMHVDDNLKLRHFNSGSFHRCSYSRK